MKLYQHKKSPFPLLLLGSVVLHALVYVVWSLSWGGKGQQSDEKSFIVQLSYVQPKPGIEESVQQSTPEIEKPEVQDPLVDEENVLIDHLVDTYKVGEEYSSDTRDLTAEPVLDFGAKQEIVRKKELSKANEGRSFVETIAVTGSAGTVGDKTQDSPSKSSVVTDLAGIGIEKESSPNTVGDAEQGAESEINFIPPEELKIPPEFLGNLGNMELLQENDLGNAFVEDPFSDKESKELKLVNRYLRRFTEQIYEFLVNPYQGSKPYDGIIRFELDTKGYLIHSFIYRSSGHRLLDISVLDAIRAVPRFEVPESEIITRQYYSNLSFHYSSKDEETELMPFEEEPGQATN